MHYLNLVQRTIIFTGFQSRERADQVFLLSLRVYAIFTGSVRCEKIILQYQEIDEQIF